MRYLAFLIYIILWDVGILVGTSYLVFAKGHSGWWFLLAIVIMYSSFKPKHFGIEQIGNKH